ncbi:MAG: HAD-IA family hydrolase [Planctomycetota bacterium]
MNALVFDNGDILFDASRWRRWLAAYLAGHGTSITYEELVVRWEWHLESVYKGRREYWDAFHKLLSELGLESHDISLTTEVARSKAQKFSASRRPMAGVPTTLKTLASLGIKLAVLSDTESGEAGVRVILKQLGIESCFDAVVSSADIGSTKPEPAAYAAAIRALGVSASNCGFVGHDLDELVGARQFGLVPIAFNHSSDVPADIYLDSFDQILTAVELRHE